MYAENLRKYLKAYFDLEEGPFYSNSFSFEFKATYRQTNIKYLLSKKWQYYSFINNEYIFFAKIKTLKDTYDIINWLNINYKSIIDLKKNHMSSYITIILEVENSLSDLGIRAIKRFKFYKSFYLGFKGWLNVRLIVIDPINNCGYANKFGMSELPKYLKIIS